MSKLVKNLNNNKPFLFLGFLFLVLFLFWPNQTLAFWETLKNAILYLPYAFIALIFVLFIVLTQAFAWFMGYILDIVLSPSFISLSYTNPTNPVIRAGLSITQSFVNLFLVVALVYTAFSIALRLNETQAKKMLAKLIVVALLVNFAPLLCGLVVDATNIVMYYFLEPIQEGVSGVLTQLGPSVDIVISSLKKVSADLSERRGVVTMAFTQITVNISVGIAFFLFAGIFLTRYLAIWTLVILAPIAFVAWVFPFGRVRAFFNMWLSQFIQWSIIGIPIAFFLYLAMSSFNLINAVFKQKIEMPGIESSASGFLNDSFPYLVVVVFLFLGFTIGLQTGAMGGAAILKGGRAAGTAAARMWMRTGMMTARAIARGAFMRGRIGYRRERQAGRGRLTALGLGSLRAITPPPPRVIGRWLRRTFIPTAAQPGLGPRIRQFWQVGAIGRAIRGIGRAFRDIAIVFYREARRRPRRREED